MRRGAGFSESLNIRHPRSVFKLEIERHTHLPTRLTPLTASCDRLSAPGIGSNYNRLLQQFRREDGPSGEREISLPIRASHIRQLAAPDSGFDTTGSRWACVRWSLVLASLHALLRGCEPGVVGRTHPF